MCSSQLSYWPISLGGDKRDRTADLLLARQALSQLSYAPVVGAKSALFGTPLRSFLSRSLAPPLKFEPASLGFKFVLEDCFEENTL